VVIGFCALAESVLFLSAIISPGYLSGAVSFTCAGVFASVIGPSLNSYLGGKFSHCTATAFSLFAGLGGIGAAIGPLLIGTIGDQFGVERGILSSPLFSALLGIAALTSFSREYRRTNAERSLACDSAVSSSPDA
jgi:fucose permease